jgi:hypothetical protein
MFARHAIELPDQTLCDWMGQCALLEPLYERRKRHVLSSRVVGADDTPVKALDRKLPQARQGASATSRTQVAGKAPKMSHRESDRLNRCL